MTRNITTSFRRSAEANFSDEVDLCFLTITHPLTPDQTIRAVWDTQDFYYGENVFVGFPFDITILSDDENPPQARLTIQNVDPNIGEVIRFLPSPLRLKIELSLSSEFFYSLLLHFDGADGSQSFVDSGGNNITVTAINQAQIDTAQNVFGSGSALFDGIDDYLQVSASSLLQFGTGDFTVSFRFRTPTVNPAIQYILYDSGAADQVAIWFPTDSWHILLDESSNQILDESSSSLLDGYSSTIAVYSGFIGNAILQGTTQIQTDTWYHVEVTRSSGTLRMFINGINEGGSYFEASDYTDNSPTIGANASVSAPFKGWIDELRIITGVAAHTADFALPFSQYKPSFAVSPEIIYSADKLFLVNISVDIMQITGTIVGWDYLQRVWPGPRAMQAVFPGLFR